MFDDKGDVSLWIEYGTGTNDPTTKEQRKEISDLGKIYTFNPNYTIYCNMNHIPVSKKTFFEYLEMKQKFESSIKGGK